MAIRITREEYAAFEDRVLRHYEQPRTSGEVHLTRATREVRLQRKDAAQDY